jgi:hypothetical protein
MQLKMSIQSKRSLLMAASCALLATPVAHAEEGDWQADSALLYYHENNGRVSAIEPIVTLKSDFGDDRLLTTKIAYDSLSGASPNGALSSRGVQTFATPSGTSLVASPCVQTYSSPSGGGGNSCHSTVYDVAPGAIPLSTFKDKRFAGGASWQQPVGRLNKLTVGTDVSKENDFMSMSVNGTFARDFFNRNTTVSLGGSWEHDISDPIGGTPVPGSRYTLFQKTSAKEARNVSSAMLGLTQVMNRRWLVQLNFTTEKSNGYQTDPYKIISIVDATGLTSGYLFESRPDNRSRHGVYLENRIAVGDTDVITLSARHMTDNWGLTSSTADFRYRWEFSSGSYLEPHVRYYQQNAANFYQPYMPAASQTLQYFSADPRLAALTGKTIGLKWGVPLEQDGEFSIRLEMYRQTGRNVASVPGVLQGLDTFPSLTTEMLQVGWRF